MRDKKTKEPLARAVTRRIFDECVRRGLLDDVLRAELPDPTGAHDRPRDRQNGIAILREVFDLMKRERAWEGERA